MELTIDKLKHFINWSLVQLATNANIHYDREYGISIEDVSLLYLKMEKHNYNIEFAIHEVCEEVVANKNILYMFNELQKGDNTHFSESDLFYDVVHFIGLFALCILNDNDYDKFKDKFYDVMYC